MNQAVALGPVDLFKKAGARETAALLVVAWFIPFAIHLAPWSGARPLGAYLLPMFWTAFVAVYFYGARMGLLVAIFGPATNLFVTGLPAWKFLSVMTVELVVYALVTTWAVRRAPRMIWIAPLGYLVAKVASTGLQMATPVFGEIGRPEIFFARSIAGVVAGLAVLAAINAGLVRFYPKASSATR